MNKKGKMLVVIMGVLIQIMLGVVYGFFEAPISETMCFGIWCVCAVVINRMIRTPEIV